MFSSPHRSARWTVSPFLIGAAPVRVFLVVRVTLGTMGLLTIHIVPPASVLRLSDRLHMRRIDASSNSTQVVDRKPVRNRFTRVFIDHTRSQPVTIQTAITVPI